MLFIRILCMQGNTGKNSSMGLTSPIPDFVTTETLRFNLIHSHLQHTKTIRIKLPSLNLQTDFNDLLFNFGYSPKNHIA